MIFQLSTQVLSTWLASGYQQTDKQLNLPTKRRLWTGGGVFIYSKRRQFPLYLFFFCQKKKLSCAGAGGRGYFCSLTKSHYLDLVVGYSVTAIFIQVWSKWVRGQGDKRVTYSLGFWSLLSYLHICILLIMILYFQGRKSGNFRVFWIGFFSRYQIQCFLANC